MPPFLRHAFAHFGKVLAAVALIAMFGAPRDAAAHFPEPDDREPGEPEADAELAVGHLG